MPVDLPNMTTTWCFSASEHGPNANICRLWVLSFKQGVITTLVQFRKITLDQSSNKSER